MTSFISGKREIMDGIERKMNLTDVKIMDKILSEQDRIIWESMGLTPDVQSMENATLLTKVRFYIFKMPRATYKCTTFSPPFYCRC